MKKTLAFLILTLMTINGFAQLKKDVVYIRIQEGISKGTLIESYIRIIYPDKTSKLIQLSVLGAGGKMSEENGKIIHTEITNLLSEGYELISSTCGGDIYLTTTIMIFSRPKEK